MRTQLVDGLFADLLQVVRFLRVYATAGVPIFKMFITRIRYYNLLRLFTYFADESIQVHEFDMRFPIAQSDASDGQEDAPIRDRSALWPGGVIPYEYGNSISEYKLISYLMFVVFDV